MFLIGDNISGDVTVEGRHGREFIREDSEWVRTKGGERLKLALWVLGRDDESNLSMRC